MAEVCDVNNRPPAPDENLDDNSIKTILQNSKTIAVVGLSNKPNRESYGVGKYLVTNGYEIFPVHPNIKEWEGKPVYKSLADIPQKIDIVDLFRRSDAIDEMVDDIIAVKPKVVWLQLGIVNNKAAKKFRAAGLLVVQNKCIKIEHYTLVGGGA